MKTKMVRITLDLANVPPLTPAQIAELDALDAMPESEIDYSDIPPLDESFWKNAIRNPFLYKPTKTSTTVRIDSDVLHWLRARGKGYQSRINAILRREMLRSINSSTAGGPEPGRPSLGPASSKRGSKPSQQKRGARSA